MEGITARSDFHLGHILLAALSKNSDTVCQIDASTGQEETTASVLSRSVKLATSFRNVGFSPGDVVAISGWNHLDVHIPYYAGLFTGMPVSGIDPFYKYDEVVSILKIVQPKVVFCEPKSYSHYTEAAKALKLDTTVLVFGKGKNSMHEFAAKHGGDESLEAFKPTDIDLEKVYAWLCTTSGTTGKSKVAAISHQACVIKIMSLFALFKRGALPKTTGKSEVAVNLGPFQWMSGFFNAFVMPLIGQCKVQTSAPITVDHVIDIIEKYKPVSMLMTPSMLVGLLNSPRSDFSSFNYIGVTGAKTPIDMLHKLRTKISKSTIAMDVYGQTENIGQIMWPSPSAPESSSGQILPSYKAKLVDPETGKEITEPNIQGDLWTKGPMFTEYYNNPEETALSITQDGWFKTGDLFYRDENNNYYYVDRLKALIKYRIYHVMPSELEEVIRSHTGVSAVVVTSVPHHEDGEHPVACVVKRPGTNVTAQEIKDLVASKLSDSKRLRGGVFFLVEIPMTSTGKVALAKLKKMVIDLSKQ